jgi:hypothetical protein
VDTRHDKVSSDKSFTRNSLESLESIDTTGPD